MRQAAATTAASWSTRGRRRARTRASGSRTRLRQSAPTSGEPTSRSIGRREFPDGVEHSGTFPGVAHPYVADVNSGPIDYLQLGTLDSGVLDANSRNIGPDRSVLVTVGVRNPLKIEDPLTPPILLRVASPSGSQNQAFDCDQHANLPDRDRKRLRDHATDSTTTTGTRRRTATRSGRTSSAIQYDVADLPPDATRHTTPRPICVAVEDRGQDRAVPAGAIQARFENPTCCAEQLARRPGCTRPRPGGR